MTTDAPLPEEVRKKFKLPPGATFKDLPPGAIRRSPQAKRYFRAVISLAAKVEADIPLATGAVIAWEQLGLTQEAWQLDAPIKLSKPLRGKVPAGTILVREVREADGEELYCIARASSELFEPFVDDRRAIYPSACLFDGDKDGSPDSVLAEPYRPENRVIRLPIGGPVAWTPLSVQSRDPRSLSLSLTRQLAVEEFDAQRITLASRLTDPIVSKMANWSSTELLLRDGEQVAIDGITVTVAKVDGAWHLRSSGRFVPWAALRPDRLGYRILPSEASAPER